MDNQNYDILRNKTMDIVQETGWDKAIRYLDDYIIHHPESFEAYLLRGEMHLEMGNYKESHDDLENAVKINSNESQVYYTRGLLLIELNENNAEILSNFNKAIELNPKDIDAYINRSVIELRMEKYHWAIDDCNKAICLYETENEEQELHPYYNRGIAYAKLKETDKAINDFNRVISFNPEYSEAYLKRGALHSMQGNASLAIKDFKEFLKLNPNDEDAVNVRNEIAKMERNAFNKGNMNGNMDSMSTTGRVNVHKIFIFIGCGIAVLLSLILCLDILLSGGASSDIGISIGMSLLIGFAAIGLPSLWFSVKKAFSITYKAVKSICSIFSNEGDLIAIAIIVVILVASVGFVPLYIGVFASPFVGIYRAVKWNKK